jgi:hypothetical protein
LTAEQVNEVRSQVYANDGTVVRVTGTEREKAEGRTGRIAAALLRMDAVILDQLG